jgi:hypothetical protein
MYWPLVEASLGIIAANLPLLLPIVRDLSVDRFLQIFERARNWKRPNRLRQIADAKEDISLDSPVTAPPTAHLKGELGWLKLYHDS